MKQLADETGLSDFNFKPLIVAGTDVKTDSAVSFRFFLTGCCYVHLMICMQVKPNERAYWMNKIQQNVLDKQSAKEDAAKESADEEDASEEGAAEEGAAEEDAAEDEPAKKTVRKQSAVEGLMKKEGYNKGGSFRREQMKLDVILPVLKRFGRVHDGMVSVMVVLFCSGHN